MKRAVLLLLILTLSGCSYAGRQMWGMDVPKPRTQDGKGTEARRECDRE